MKIKTLPVSQIFNKAGSAFESGAPVQLVKGQLTINGEPQGIWSEEYVRDVLGVPAEDDSEGETPVEAPQVKTPRRSKKKDKTPEETPVEKSAVEEPPVEEPTPEKPAPQKQETKPEPKPAPTPASKREVSDEEFGDFSDFSTPEPAKVPADFDGETPEEVAQNGFEDELEAGAKPGTGVTAAPFSSSLDHSGLENLDELFPE